MGGMALRKIEHVAARKQLLTLDEVEAWVRDARRSGATGSEIVAARVSFGGKLQKVSVEVETVKVDVGDKTL